jgi:hypothetical protein
MAVFTVEVSSSFDGSLDRWIFECDACLDDERHSPDRGWNLEVR